MLNIFAFLSAATSLLCLGFGLFIFSRNPRHAANGSFFLAMITLAITEAGNGIFFFFGPHSPFRDGALLLALAGQSFMPLGWIIFSVVFAKAEQTGKNLLKAWALPLLLVAVGGLYFFLAALEGNLVGLAEGIPLPSDFEGSTPLLAVEGLGIYYYIYLIVGAVVALINLENTLRHSTGIKRWQIKYVIFGVGGILAFYIYYASQALMFRVITFQSVAIITTVVLLSSAMMTVFVVRHRLLEVDVFVSRYVVYNSATALIVGGYLLVVGLVTEGIKLWGGLMGGYFTSLFVFGAFLVLVITLFSHTVQRKFKLFINRNFYKHKYEFRDKWMETIERVSGKRTIKETVQTLAEMIMDTMGVQRVYIWIYDSISHSYYLAYGEGVDEEFKRIEQSHPIVKSLSKEEGPFLVSDLLPNRAGLEVRRLVDNTGAVLCSPFYGGGDMVGFLLQSEDVSGEPYQRDDFEILKAVTTQSAVAIKRIRLGADLLASREVEAFHRGASFVLHDLKNLTNSLSLISENAKSNMDNPEFQKDAIKTIDYTVSKMKKVMAKLSSVPKKVELRREACHIEPLISRVIGQLSFEKKEIDLVNKVEKAPAVDGDGEALEMVLTNILNNAGEAILGRGEIRLSAVPTADMVVLTIKDNGRGMSRKFMEKSLFRPFRTTKKKGFGIGLYQCKTIVEAHGGSIDVESEEGEGTTFVISLPRYMDK